MLKAVPLILNIAALQAAWFASVLGAAHGHIWVGILACSLAVLAHLARVSRPAMETRLILAGGAVGFVAESILMASGAARYASNLPFESAPPFWLIALWMAFATTLNISLAVLKSRPWAAALLGAIGGAAAYGGGARLGGMTLADPLWLSLAAVGVVWAVALPLLVAASLRWDGAMPRASA